MKKQKISWTEATWNPFIGCDKVSPGCEHCYAIPMSYRLAHIPATKAIYEKVVKKTAGGKLNWTGTIQENYPQMDKPLRTKKPTIFFVNSMSDLFHEELSFAQIDSVFELMSQCPQHTFQVLTKRPQSMLSYYRCKNNGDGIVFNQWPLKNVWVGVSVENQKYADERIPILLRIPAAVRFLSCEPLLGRIDLTRLQGPAGSLYHQVLNAIENFGDSNRAKIDWVIVGGESGPNARPMHPEWVRLIRGQCDKYNVPFLFKQWGSWLPYEPDAQAPFWNTQDGRMIDGHLLPSFEEMEYSKRWHTKWYLDFPFNCFFENVGKDKSGNKLDGKSYQEFPKAERSVANQAQ